MEYGWMLLRMVVVLGAVCALAYVSLRLGLRRLVGHQTGAGRRLEVIERLGLGPRRALLVVRAGSKVVLLGSSETGLSTLTELEAEDWTLAATDGELEAAIVKDRETATLAP